MNENPDPTPSKRKRGRPQGSAPLRAQDMKHLQQLARAKAHDSSVNVTRAFKSYGVNELKDLSRLRARWRSDGPALLKAAKTDLHLRQNGDWFTQMNMMFAGFSAKIGEVLETVPLGRILQRIERHHHAKQALTDQSAGRDAGFDTTDAEEVIAAIARLETRDRALGQSLIDQEDRGDGLNDWQQQYVMAAILHELALEGFRKEQADDANRTDG